MLASPPQFQIETERLILRSPIADDFDRWADFMADEEAMRFLGGAMKRGAAWRNMMVVIGSWTACGIGFFSVIEKSTGKWIGRIGPWQPDGWPGTEVGWGLMREAHGKGYALEAAMASMDYAVDVLGWKNIIHTIAEGNVASEMLAMRVGSKNLDYKAQLPAPFDDMLLNVWGQSAEDWRAFRSGLSSQKLA